MSELEPTRTYSNQRNGMSDKPATERLRELLGERGVEWKAGESEIDHVTMWKANGGHAEFYESKTTNPDLLQVNYYNLTPEQAIAATLGRGTCEIYRVGNTRDIRKCSACGKQMHFDHPLDRDCLHYCPNCGAKVVDE